MLNKNLMELVGGVGNLVLRESESGPVIVITQESRVFQITLLNEPSFQVFWQEVRNLVGRVPTRDPVYSSNDPYTIIVVEVYSPSEFLIKLLRPNYPMGRVDSVEFVLNVQQAQAMLDKIKP